MSFDENDSQGRMPRLYMHLNRVDIWIMAQKAQYDQCQDEIAELDEKLSNESMHYNECIKERDSLREERDRYAKAMALALREGIFAEKQRVNDEIAAILEAKK